MSPLSAEMVKYFPGLAEGVFWFDSNDVMDNVILKGNEVIEIVNSTPLPFDSCAVCFSNSIIKRVFFVYQQEDIVDFYGYTFRFSECEEHPVMTYQRNEDGLLIKKDSEDQAVDKAEMTQLAAVAAWLKSINQNTVCRQSFVDKDSYIGKKRIQNGKRPLIKWNTVIIGERKSRSESKGGTHASPRMHDRRGHTRTLSSGKTVWVNACKVGKASDGIGFKDYQVKS